jgi:hypothetical protein
MPPPSPHLQPSSNQALYQSTLDGAVVAARDVMAKLVGLTCSGLRVREKAAREHNEALALGRSTQSLQGLESQLCTVFPQLLSVAFANPDVAKKGTAQRLTEVHFDELELMDEVQVQTSVTLARAQQNVTLATEASLAELNTLMCSVQGLPTVRPERNPLRPEVWVHALWAAVEQLPVADVMRLDWFNTMGVALGPALRDFYLAVSQRLRASGVVASGYAVVPTASAIPKNVWGNEAQASDVVPMARASDAALLTLGKLRSLLNGEFDHTQEAESFPAVDLPVIPPVSEFMSTVPAAFEALQEMRQTDDVVNKLKQRQQAPESAAIAEEPTTLTRLRASVRGSANEVAQALSLEVVALMVQNMAQDTRLLEPVQRLIRQMEPALLQLALVDTRFFTDRQHPARVLLEEMTHRSLAFGSVETPGFDAFIGGLQQAVAELVVMQIESHEPFVCVLETLQDVWALADHRKEKERQQAVEALRHAEERNLLAEKIAREIESHTDVQGVPSVVVEFVCGPWSQVLAHARITSGFASGVAERYQSLVAALLWSANPILTRKNAPKLTRVVPRLLSILREGLESIHFPQAKTDVFLDALMGIHQQAFRSHAASLDSAASVMSGAQLVRKRVSREVWIAPQEVQASNFMELMAEPVDATATAEQSLGNDSPVDGWTLGTWVELETAGQWVRMQLTWASPHATLFLFTTITGSTQSMTHRARDKLLANGRLKRISGVPVVDGALDAVAQQAMRNSLDSLM